MKVNKSMDFWFEERVHVLASELKYVKSVDGYLVKLVSLAYDLEDQCYGDIIQAKRYFEKALRHPSVKYQLTSLSCYRDIVEATVQKDPRFKKLRDYIDVLNSVLAEIECREEKSLTTSREATFRIEATDKRNIESRRYWIFSKKHQEILVKVIIGIGVLLVILALLLILAPSI